MSKMALIWALLYTAGLAGALFHPFYPFLSYILFYYLPPHVNWWGRDLPDLRYSLIASVVMLASWAMLQSGLEQLKRTRNPALLWILFFGANAIVATVWALDAARSWFYTVVVLKLVLLYVLIPCVVRTPAHFEMFGAAHVAGASYWGYKAWDNPKRKQGRLMEVGGPDSQNDNQAAGHLLTVMPFAALYVLTEKRRGRQALFAIAAAFVVNVFILCNSRGATLGMVAAGLSAIVLAGKGRRKKMTMAGALGLAALLFLADPEYIARQQTTADPTDNSAQSRMIMWRAGLRMVDDHPLGGGGRTFHILSPRYLPDETLNDESGERSPHNTYVQLGTDWGVQGTAFFFLFLLMTLRVLHRIRRRTPANDWYFYRSLTVEVALVGTMSAAFFSSRLYGESIYWMCALAVALERMQVTELAAAEAPQAAVVVDRPALNVPAAIASHG